MQLIITFDRKVESSARNLRRRAREEDLTAIGKAHFKRTCQGSNADFALSEIIEN